MAPDAFLMSPAPSNGTVEGRRMSSPPPMQPPLPPSVVEHNTKSTNHESSPLLQHDLHLDPANHTTSPFTDNAGEDVWAMPNRSSMYMIYLTLVMAGLQVAWSVELAYINPYLLSLGLPKSALSLIWVAGPVSGVVVQPAIGMMSDRTKFTWGRRRVFIIVSTIGVVLGFIGMGRTKSIVCFLTGRQDWDSIRTPVIALAIASLIVLDLAINATTAAARALIVDCVPTHQQNTANAWAGRMIGVGNVIGYLSGYINLPQYLPSLGDTQFQILCILAPVTLVTTVTITCAAIREVDPALLLTLQEIEQEKRGGLHSTILMLTSVARLPRRVRQICNVQFFAWIVIIWNTTYTGEIYVRRYLRSHPPPANRREEDLLWEHATRIASFALLLQSFTSLLSNLILPFFLHGRLAIPGLTLRRLWIASHVLFALSMWSTLFISSVAVAVTMVSVVGISWALTLWAPFALIAQCVSHIQDVSRRESIASSRASTPDLRPADHSTYGSVGQSGISVSNPEERAPSISTPSLKPQAAGDARRHSLQSAPLESPGVIEKKDQVTSAGAIMGLHNVFISAPQFISTLLASAIFHFLGAGGRENNINPQMGPFAKTQATRSIAWVLSVGGVGGVIAAYLAWVLDEEFVAFGHPID